MRFQILGPMEITGDTGKVVIAAHRQQIILMLLLVEANRPVPVERLIEAVWGDSPPSTAKGQIQICVSQLRGKLGAVGLSDSIITVPTGYASRIAEGMLDLQVFEDQVRLARKAVNEGKYVEAEESYQRALGEWRSNALTTVESRVLEAVEVRLVDRRVAVIEEWAEVRLRLGLHQELIGELADLVERYPLRETLRVKLMLALYRSGRQAEALEVYRAGRQLLVDELGIEPGNELRQMEKDILSGALEVEPAPAIPVAPAAPSATVVPRLLPGDVSDFTGHTDLIQGMSGHLIPDSANHRNSGVPVVTISGKAGVGKTTLAIHVGHELAPEFPDGQLFINLNGLSAAPVTPEQALERFLRALGVSGTSVPSGLDERAEIFRQQVADRRILVILDDAAAAEQVRWLLPGSPSCSVIITSRFRLTGLSGSMAAEVEVLDTETAMKMLMNAVGSDRVYAELGKTIELIGLCGGLPIALRIAAARLTARPHWSIERFVERLNDESNRLDELTHQDLGVRAHLELTVQALTEPARRLFRRLGMIETSEFPGWVAAPLLGVAAIKAEEALEELIDAQFVDVERVAQGRHVRFRLHDLIRAYSRERLAEEESPADRTSALKRLMSAWLFLTQEAHRREYGGDHTVIHGDAERWELPASVVDGELADPIQWYETERNGIVAAVRQAAGCGMDELCWDLALTAVTLFETRSYFDDWRATHEVALAETRRTGNRRGEAAMLYSLGTLRLFEQRFSEAAQWLEPAERLFKEVGDGHGHALALRNMAVLDRVQGRLDTARNRCEAALTGLRAAGDQIGEVHALTSLAQIHMHRSDWQSAERLLTSALDILDEVSNRRVQAQVQYRLGEVQLIRESYADASITFEQVVAASHAYGDQVGETYALLGLGHALSKQGYFKQAEEQLLKAQSHATFLSHRLLVGRVGLALGQLYLSTEDAAAAQREFTQALQVFNELEMSVWRCSALDAMGDAYEALGQTETARVAWTQALSLSEELEDVASLRLRDQLKSKLES